MSNKLTLFLILGMLALGLAACGELAPPPKEADQPEAAKPKPAEPEGPYYELTKDEITSHPDWTSKNVTVMGIKLGEKTSVEDRLGKPIGTTNVLADEYQAFYQNNSLAVYTFKLTGKVTRIETLQSFASRVADSKLKGLLVSGDIKQMRDIFGKEESVTDKPSDMATEYLYDAKGFRFIKYKNGINSLHFGEVTKK